MLYAVKHNKVNRAIFKANEDSLTSSIFERLMYLPQELMHRIFIDSLLDTIPDLELHQIERIEFWPNWSSENTTNSKRVEPDVFIRTVKQDIIIEAKRLDDKQQDSEQWKREIQAYKNEYCEDKKTTVFIALGGLYKKETETITVSGDAHLIYKCTWKSILNAVQNSIHDLELGANYTNNNKALLKILNDIVLCLELFGFSTSLWLERFVQAPRIQQKSLSNLSIKWIN